MENTIYSLYSQHKWYNIHIVMNVFFKGEEKMKNIIKKYSEMSLVVRIIIGFAIGAVLGLLCPNLTFISILGLVFDSMAEKRHWNLYSLRKAGSFTCGLYATHLESA